MAEPISIQQLKDASEDAISLSEFVNEDEYKSVPRRLALPINTLDYYIKYFKAWEQVYKQPNGTVTVDGKAVKSIGQIAIDAENIVNDAINNTAVEGGVLADTFLTATAYHPDTYARTQRSIRADTVSLLDFIPIALHEGIRAYTYADNIAPYMQKAVDYCTLYNKELYCPAGGYMIDPATNTNVGVYLINNWGQDKNLIVTGAGQGLTVFREKAGATTIGGRFTKMFYVYFGLGSFVGDFGHVKFSGMTLDKNGRSNTNPERQAKIDAGQPVTTAERYFYEQAHILGAAGSGTVNIKSFQFDNIEIVDKVGAGLNFSSSPLSFIRKVFFNNITSRENSKVDNGWGDGTFGARGCIELGTNIGTAEITNPDIEYAQIEPVIPSSPTLQRSSSVTGGVVDVFEWTDKGGYSFASVTNLRCPIKFLTRGINVTATNITAKVPEVFAEGIVKISNSKLLLKYDSTTNTVTPLSFATVAGYLGYGEMWLSDVSISIDSPDANITPLGFGMTGSTDGLQGSKKSFLNNVNFDPRLEKSIYAYGNGDWKIANCDIYGTGSQVVVGAVGANRGGNVELINNNYLGTGTKIEIQRNSDNFTLSITGTYAYTNFYRYVGVSSIDNKLRSKPILTSATKPTGFAPKGQVVINTAPVAGSYEKWIKTVEDASNATWKGVGLIEGDVAAITSGTTAQRPTGVAVGFTYFDTTLGKPVYFKSVGVWVDSTGAAV